MRVVRFTKMVLVFLLNGLLCLEAFAETERIYKPAESPWSPVTVSTEGAGVRDPERGVVDPQNPTSVSQVTTVQKMPAGVKAKKLTFQKISIKGRVAAPRIKFSRENLKISRLDELLPRNFLPRVYDTKPGEL